MILIIKLAMNMCQILDCLLKAVGIRSFPLLNDVPLNVRFHATGLDFGGVSGKDEEQLLN